jgi:hypothetical protein
MLTAILLALLAADRWRRRRAFKQRIDEIDAFLEWHTYDDGTPGIRRVKPQESNRHA